MSTRTVHLMYSIGDLAQRGGVTPRMLRHYQWRTEIQFAIEPDPTR